MQKGTDSAPLKEDMPHLFSADLSVAKTRCWKNVRGLEKLGEVPMYKIESMCGTWVKK